MTARLLMTAAEVEEDRAGWLAARRAGITASEIASVLGIAPGEHGSPFALYHDKLLGEVEFDNEEMALGRYMEDYVAQRFAATHPEFLVGPGGLYASRERPWQLATFDRLAYDAGSLDPWERDDDPARGALAPVQCKTAGSAEEWGSEPEEGIIPAHYRAQCLWEMDVADTDLVFCPVMFLFSRKVVTYVLERDASAEEDIEFMRYRADDFLLRLANHDPPPVDWTPATTRTLHRIHPTLEDRAVRIPRRLAERYRAAEAAKDAAERRLGLVKNQIQDRLGNASRAVLPGLDGKPVTVATRRRYDQRRIDLALLRLDWPDAVKACEGKSLVDGLWPGAWVRKK